MSDGKTRTITFGELVDLTGHTTLELTTQTKSTVAQCIEAYAELIGQGLAIANALTGAARIIALEEVSIHHLNLLQAMIQGVVANL